MGALAVAGAVLGAALLSSLRSDMVSVLGSYYYDDGCESCGTDTFSREPFIVKFSSPTTREHSWCWGLPGPGTGSPPCRADPRAMPARQGGCTLVPSSGVPPGFFTAVGPSPTHGCPGVLGTCPAWPVLPAVSHDVPSVTISHHIPSPVISHHAFSPAVCHLTSPVVFHHVTHPITCYLPSCVISHHLLPPVG